MNNDDIDVEPLLEDSRGPASQEGVIVAGRTGHPAINGPNPGRIRPPSIRGGLRTSAWRHMICSHKSRSQ